MGLKRRFVILKEKHQPFLTPESFSLKNTFLLIPIQRHVCGLDLKLQEKHEYTCKKIKDVLEIFVLVQQVFLKTPL